MCTECKEKNHLISVKEKHIRRLERKVSSKTSLPIILGIILSFLTLMGAIGSLFAFSFKTYYKHEDTVLLANQLKEETKRNKEDINSLKHETAKDIALINQSMQNMDRNIERMSRIIEKTP